MGYRSDVAYMITFHKPEDYWGFVAEAKCDPETQFCFSDDGFKQDDEHLALMFSADSVKWYPDYEDVKCHNKLWCKALDRDEQSKETCDGYYVRIGEETDDIDEKQFGIEPPYDYINIHRSIQINWS